MKNLFITLIIALIQLNGLSQEGNHKVKVLVSSRVDTSDVEIMSVYKTYINYLNSRPDSIYDNPYWNEVEKSIYTDFDFSRLSMFQTGKNSNQLFKIFVPFVMSIEPIGEKYQIRTMFSSPTTNPTYAGSKVWCIQKLNAIQENDKWVLENLISEVNKNWNKKNIGIIEYIYPTIYSFNSESAQKSITFCQNILGRFNPTFDSSFKYYLTNNVDQMGLLENFDYFFVGISKGKSRNNMLFSANGNEFYPHEFIHKLLPVNTNRGYVIEEGLAVFLGTKMDSVEYYNLMKKLALDLKSDSKRINFESVISQKIRFNGYQTAYPSGAAICELVFLVKGDAGLQKLMLSDTSNYPAIIIALKEVTGLSEERIIREWGIIMQKYER